jgi:hypothetical protein
VHEVKERLDHQERRHDRNRATASGHEKNCGHENPDEGQQQRDRQATGLVPKRP